jgi:hypothetical protein
MEKFIEHIIEQDTHILNKTKVEILFIGDIQKYREKIDNSYIKFIDYLRENLYDYKIIYYGTNIPKFIKGQQLNMIINKYCTTSEPLIWISGLSGAKLVNKIYDYKGIKILNVNTISDKVKQHINENGYDYVLYTNNVLNKDNIEIEDCPCVKFITIGNYVDENIFKNYKIERIYDVLYIDNIDNKRTELEDRLYKILKNSVDIKTYFLTYTKKTSINDNYISDKKLSDLINKSKAVFTTIGQKTKFNKIYIQIALSNSCIIRSKLNNIGKINDSIIIDNTYNDNKIIETIKQCINNHKLIYKIVNNSGKIARENYTFSIGSQIMNNIFNKICEKVIVNENIKIDQIYVSRGLESFKEKFKNKYSLVDYHDRNKPVIFFGLYYPQDFHIIRNHRGLGLMIWGGTDSSFITKWNMQRYIDYQSDEIAHTLNLKELIDSYKDNRRNVLLSFIKNRTENFSILTEFDTPGYFLDVMRRPNIKHLAISNDISEDLLNVNIKSQRLILSFIDKSKFKPSIKGNSVYIYTSETHPNRYGYQIYKSIIEKMSDINFIVAIANKYTKIEDIYEKCFIGLRLTSHDGNANTVQELGLSGIKCVHNGDFPNGISWKTEDDVINIIRQEQKMIGTKDDTLTLKMLKYLDDDEDWLNVKSYAKCGIRILHIIERDENYRSHLTFNDNDNIEYLYLTSIKNIETKQKLSNKTVYYYDDYEDAYNIIIRLNVDAIITSNDIILSKYHQRLVKTGVLLYRIYHGVLLDYYIHKYDKQLINDYKYYEKIFCNARLQIKLDKVEENNYYGLNGLTQIDYLLNNRDEVGLRDKFCEKIAIIDNKYRDIFTKERRYILFLTNNKLHHIDEYTIILNELKNFANKYDYYIIVKVKQYSELSKKLDKFKIDNRVIIVNNADLLYDYLFSDIVVVQSGGTAYLESLLIGKPTILCKILDKKDYMNIKNFNYDSLLVIEDRKNFETVLNLIESKSYYNVKYIQNVQNLLADFFNKTEMITDRIIEIIMEDITNCNL